MITDAEKHSEPLAVESQSPTLKQIAGRQLMFAIGSALICMILSLGITDWTILSTPEGETRAELYPLVSIMSYGGFLGSALSGLLLPTRFLKKGCLSFSVLQPLAFILVALIAHSLVWCDRFGEHIADGPTATQIVVISCLLNSCKAQFTNHRFTTKIDSMIFVMLLAVYVVTLKILWLNMGVFSHERGHLPY